MDATRPTVDCSVDYPVVTHDGQQVVFRHQSATSSSLCDSRLPAAPWPRFRIGRSASRVSTSTRCRSIVIPSPEWILTFRLRQSEADQPYGNRPRWTPDGRAWYVKDTNIWSGHRTAARRQVTEFTDGRVIGHFAWSPDGSSFVSRATFSSDIVLFRGLKGRTTKTN